MKELKEVSISSGVYFRSASRLGMRLGMRGIVPS
jgi:hypothetical protein